jgi:hypothetical protein
MNRSSMTASAFVVLNRLSVRVGGFGGAGDIRGGAGGVRTQYLTNILNGSIFRFSLTANE